MPTAALRAIPPSTAAVDDNITGHAVKCRRMYSHPVSVQHDTYTEMKLSGLITQLVTQLNSFQPSASSVSVVHVALVVIAEALQAYSVRHEVRCELFILLTAVS